MDEQDKIITKPFKVAAAPQGEGDREADKRYREAAREFVDSGRVPEAARASREAIEGPEADELNAAEKEGKRHIADAGKESEPMPSFWTDRQQNAWERIREALHRDWLQTKSDLGMKSGAELGQSATDTIEQAAGSKPMPNSADVGLDWDLARHAIRLGHGAATFWEKDDKWGEDIEGRLRSEWFALDTHIPWEQALPLVRFGWEAGRKDMERKDIKH